ncbi:MAG: four helix bundle protein [Candidatus Cloacimonetes bacterium]|nr:four helix bundle protein [Candidatus Cloacimonadota bacterium]
MIIIELFKTIDCFISGISHGVNKLKIVLKELRESFFWLQVIKKTKLLSPQRLKNILPEASELSNIIAKSIITTQKHKNYKK